MYEEEFHNLWSSKCGDRIIRMVSSRTVRWAKYASRILDVWRAYKSLIEKPELRRRSSWFWYNTGRVWMILTISEIYFEVVRKGTSFGHAGSVIVYCSTYGCFICALLVILFISALYSSSVYTFFSKGDFRFIQATCVCKLDDLEGGSTRNFIW